MAHSPLQVNVLTILLSSVVYCWRAATDCMHTSNGMRTTTQMYAHGGSKRTKGSKEQDWLGPKTQHANFRGNSLYQATKRHSLTDAIWSSWARRSSIRRSFSCTALVIASLNWICKQRQPWNISHCIHKQLPVLDWTVPLWTANSLRSSVFQKVVLKTI